MDFRAFNWEQYLGFFYFEFEIRLIRLGFSKNKNSCIWAHNPLILSQDWESIKSQLWVGDPEKLTITFNHTWLILLIKQIRYRIWKTGIRVLITAVIIHELEYNYQCNILQDILNHISKI